MPLQRKTKRYCLFIAKKNYKRTTPKYHESFVGLLMMICRVLDDEYEYLILES